MNLHCATRELHPRHAFRISRARRTEVRNVFVRLDRDGLAGYGEASPNSFYGETWEGVMSKLEDARDFLSALEVRNVAEIETAWSEIWPFLAPSRAAQCAVDVALWDWLARREGVTACELAWSFKPKPVTTFCTIGLSTFPELLEKVRELIGFPRIKIKADSTADARSVRFVRDRCPSALLAVDANCAWSGVDLAAASSELVRLGVAFIEQPLPPERDAEMLRAELPILADESCVTENDVERVVASFDGFNIKLVKCGGITPARRMVERGRAYQKSTMVGCMLESSALIAAGAVIAQGTDYADLDGAWLIGDDPFGGWRFDRGTLHPPVGAGLGAVAEPGLFPAL